MSRIKFLNISIDNLSFYDAIDEIKKLVERRIPSYVVTPNVDHLVKLEKDPLFRKIYENASLILADGVPLIWMSKLKGTPIKEKVSGSDLFPGVCKMAAQEGYGIFFLGGVAPEEAEKKLKQKYSDLRVVGTYSPKYGFENDPAELKYIIDLIKEASPDILAVGLGAPKQEKFIYRFKDELNVSVCLAIGASIDFEAGIVPRAPRWMQKIGLEWFYRLYKEPKRMFKRYLIDDVKIVKIFFKY